MLLYGSRRARAKDAPTFTYKPAVSLEPRKPETASELDRIRAPSAAESAQFAVALEACREALASKGSADTSLGAMREAIAILAAMARRGHIPPERLLAELKELIGKLPQIPRKESQCA